MALERRVKAEYYVGFDPEAFAAQIKKEAAARKAAEQAAAGGDKELREKQVGKVADNLPGRVSSSEEGDHA